MENKMKVIFLDIDGVLNTEVYLTAFFDICKKMDLKQSIHLLRDEYGNHFDPVALRMLNWVIGETGAKLVISSTWRMSGLKAMKDMWRDRGLYGDVIDITPVHGVDHIEEYIQMLPENDLHKYYTPDRGVVRGHEIEQWLSENTVESYVIIDDEDDMLKKQMGNFVQTNAKYGLTDKDAEACIKILNQNKEDE